MPVSEHPSIQRKERDIAALNEMLESEGWSMLLERVFLPDIATSMRNAFDFSLRGQHDKAGKEAAHGDAIIQSLVTIYRHAERSEPDTLKRLRKGHTHEHDRD